jgi:hypothetical protein
MTCAKIETTSAAIVTSFAAAKSISRVEAASISMEEAGASTAAVAAEGMSVL